MRPGIVSRGYGAAVQGATAVTANADPRRFGDEPVLLAQRSRCPVYIGRDRPGAAAALLRAHRDCDVILSDDGLQHYRLARDFEIAVLDGARRFGNGLMLPAGPLREPQSRLRTVDALVVNGPGEVVAHNGAAVFRMALEGRAFTNLLNPRHTAGPEQFQRQRVHAVAGIGNPERFFDHLRALGLQFRPHAFSDHHEYRREDLDYDACDAIVMTEKDAVKCAAFATEKQWALRVDAAPEPALGERVLIALRQKRKSP
jgi:tetraacyldisaccharide 4'-kinase